MLRLATNPCYSDLTPRLCISLSGRLNTSTWGLPNSSQRIKPKHNCSIIPVRALWPESVETLQCFCLIYIEDAIQQDCMNTINIFHILHSSQYPYNAKEWCYCVDMLKRVCAAVLLWVLALITVEIQVRKATCNYALIDFNVFTADSDNYLCF